MPDKKISELVDGGAPQNGDEYVIARAGDNFKVSWDSMSASNQIAVTLDGNTAGALALASSGTVTLAGGNNITLSQAGNAITISGANAGGAQTGISGIANSEGTYTSGTVELVGTGAITIASNPGQQYVFSVDPQSVQPETQTFIGGISASDTLYTSGTVRITGVGGGVTVSSNTGQRIDISVAAQSVQPETQTFIAGISASDTLYTSGNVRFTGVGGGVTVSSNTGQRVDISVAAQSVQPETQTFIAGISASNTLYTSGNVRFTGSQAVTVRSGTGQLVVIDVPVQSTQPETQTFIGGIAASNTTYTSGTVLFTGVGGGITVSSNTGQRVDLSVAAPIAATNLSVGVSTGGNTLGDTGVATGSRFVIVGSNGITASQGTAAGATTITLSGVTQSVQTQGGFASMGVSTGGNTAGNTQVSTGSRLVFAGAGEVTLSQATAAGASTITISSPVQTVQTQGILSAGVSTGGNTLGNTQVSTGSRLVLVGSGMVTASQATAAGASTITLNATQSVQTNDIPRLGVSTGGNTSGDTTVNSGTRFVLVGTNGITLSQGTAASATTVTISGITQSVQTQGILNVALSNIGNTSGDTGLNSGTRMVLAGGNNITLSASTAANATTITISAPNLGAGAFSGGVSTGGNTAGATGITGTQLVFVGSDNITLSQTTGAAGGTVSIIGPAAGGFSAGVSTGGNTAGATGVTATRIVFVGTGDVTLSQTTGANGATISFVEPYLSAYNPYEGIPLVSQAMTDERPQIQPWPVPRAYVHDRMAIGVHYSQATNSTLTVSVSLSAGLYTRNVSSISLLSSTSGSYSINGSGTASSLANSGSRHMTFAWTNTVPAGQYWLVLLSNTATAGANATLNNLVASQPANNWSGILGVAPVASDQLNLGLGMYSAVSAALPSNIAFTQITGSRIADIRPWRALFVSASV